MKTQRGDLTCTVVHGVEQLNVCETQAFGFTDHFLIARVFGDNGWPRWVLREGL